jgi:hypothetical protein
MSLHLITNTPSPPGVSDRGVPPQGVPVASIIVVRYSVAATPSQDGNDGWARVRFTPCASSPFFSGRGTSHGVLNFWRALRAWSAVSSLLKYPQKSLSRLRVGFRFSPGFAALHEQQPKRRSEEWRTQIKGISNP